MPAPDPKQTSHAAPKLTCAHSEESRNTGFLLIEELGFADPFAVS